jgi:hypothetical protein
MPDERREHQRLRLARPILATLDQASAQGNALILDLGMTGAFLEHYGEPRPGTRCHLSFRWYGEEVTYLSEIVHTAVVRQRGGNGLQALSHTGVYFLEPVGDSAARLQELMTSFVSRVFEAQRANAAGDPSTSAAILAGLGAARRKRTPGFVTCRLEDGRWVRTASDTPRQPENGFTLPAWEEESELDTLCRTYETADADGRSLVRTLAELSVRGNVD